MLVSSFYFQKLPYNPIPLSVCLMAGALLIYPLKITRQIPLRMARWFAALSVRSKKMAVLRIVGIFYGLPALLIFLSKVL